MAQSIQHDCANSHPSKGSLDGRQCPECKKARCVTCTPTHWQQYDGPINRGARDNCITDLRDAISSLMACSCISARDVCNRVRSSSNLLLARSRSATAARSAINSAYAASPRRCSSRLRANTPIHSDRSFGWERGFVVSDSAFPSARTDSRSTGTMMGGYGASLKATVCVRAHSIGSTSAETDISIGVGETISFATTCRWASSPPKRGAGNLEGSTAASNPMSPRRDGLVSPTSVCATLAPVCRTGATPTGAVATPPAVARASTDGASAEVVVFDACGSRDGAAARTGAAVGSAWPGCTGSSGRSWASRAAAAVDSAETKLAAISTNPPAAFRHECVIALAQHASWVH